MKNLNYEERLRKLKLSTLGYRRVRGDMIEMYKIINKFNFLILSQLKFISTTYINNISQISV
jgi:hypothetical protein